jgi:hypothetical protein
MTGSNLTVVFAAFTVIVTEFSPMEMTPETGMENDISLIPLPPKCC